MSSTTEDFDGPTSPSVPLNFEGWSAKPKPLDAAKHGERAVFWDDFHGSPTVVGRKNFDLHEDGCVAYTKDPIPVGSAWRITLLETTERLQTGLVSPEAQSWLALSDRHHIYIATQVINLLVSYVPGLFLCIIFHLSAPYII